MASYKAKAIILKTYKLGESDKIVKLYSQKDGIINAVGKGARRVKSKFCGRLELFNLIDLEISKGKNLDIITQAEILKSFKNIYIDFSKYVFCELIASIILKTQPGGESSDTLFKLLYLTLNEIDNLKSEDIWSLKKIICFFEAKFVKILGYTPIFENCLRCDLKINDFNISGGKNIFFSVKSGGIFCKKCSDFFDDAVNLNGSTFKFIKDLFYLKLDDFKNTKAECQDIKKAYKLIENYLNYHTDCSMDSLGYLKKIGL